MSQPSGGGKNEIFRGYDVRGKVGLDLTPELFERMGRAIAGYVVEQAGSEAGSQPPDVYLGFDGRPSGAELTEAVARGLTAGGVRVLDLGVVPTPLVYFASSSDQGSFGVAVTASHLSAEWNGLKLCRGSRPVHTDVIREAMERPDGPISAAAPNPPGCREDRRQAILDAYRKTLARVVGEPDAGAARPLRVVVDCQNAAASEVTPALLRSLRYDVATLYTDLGAGYPFGTPDPQIPVHLVPLRAEVVQQGADVGFAFDGDADRLGVVDGSGRHVPSDVLLALLAQDVVERLPGSAVVFDVLSSPVVEEAVRSAGGRPVEARSGHAYVQDLVRDERAAIGGESSGHLFFADGYRGEPSGYDDATYAAVRVLEYLGRHGPLADAIAELPDVVAGDEWRPRCPDDVKRRVVSDVEAIFAQLGYPVSAIDGVKAHFGPLCWALVRAANTEPCLSVRVVGPTQDDVSQVESEIVAIVRQAAARYDVTI